MALYAEREIENQGEHYVKHVIAMTSEGLHSKSDIAAELAHRDIRISVLEAMIRRKLDLIRCGIGANYKGNPYENTLYTEALNLLNHNEI